MNNKKQLQANNTSLAAALTNVQGLPMAEDVKHGKHAWGKYDGKSVDTVPHSITETDDTTNPAEFTIYKDIEITDGVATGIGATTVHIYDMVGGDDITTSEYPYYIFELDKTAYTDVSVTRNGMYIQGKQIKLGKGKFIEITVSDIPYKYPDDGGQDGFYYKKVERAANIFGHEYIDYGSFTPSQTTSSVSFNHKLSVVPKILIVLTEADFKALMGSQSIAEAIKILTYSENTHLGSYGPAVTYYNAYEQGYQVSSNSGQRVSWDKTAIRMSMTTSGSIPVFYQGQKYRWIALA